MKPYTLGILIIGVAAFLAGRWSAPKPVEHHCPIVWTTNADWEVAQGWDAENECHARWWHYIGTNKTEPGVGTFQPYYIWTRLDPHEWEKEFDAKFQTQLTTPPQTNVITDLRVTTNDVIDLRPLVHAKGQSMVATNVRIMKTGTNDAFPAITNRANITNVVNTLVADGTFCAVRGHIWADDLSHMVHAVHYINRPPEVRKCQVCSIKQSRDKTEWK